LSEYEAYSDRTSRILPWIVRIRGLFRQDKREFAMDSPNTKLIRTGQAGICHGLSECGAYSDRTGRKSLRIVRIRSLFRQDKQDIPKDSSNTRLIQAGQKLPEI
jgi:hypothetical protein